jgi:hypothetical protein
LPIGVTAPTPVITMRGIVLDIQMPIAGEEIDL